MILKVKEWNINGGASIAWTNGYEIRNWVVDEAMKNEPDIIVFTEFVISKGWDYMQNKLEEKYHWFISGTTGMNGILIAVKDRQDFDFSDIKNFEPNYINNVEVLNGDFLPDFYEIKFKVNKTDLSIIGVRIRKDIKNIYGYSFTKKQFEALDNYLSMIKHHVICIGDFNAYWPGIWNTSRNYTLSKTSNCMKLCTPVYNSQSSFSYVFPNGETASLDHAITNLKPISSRYDWSFLCDKNGYNGFAFMDKNKPKGIPDHAILITELEI